MISSPAPSPYQSCHLGQSLTLFPPLQLTDNPVLLPWGPSGASSETTHLNTLCLQDQVEEVAVVLLIVVVVVIFLSFTPNGQLSLCLREMVLNMK